MAADGAKLMLWGAYKEKIPNNLFIHDEIIFEVDQDSPEKMTEKIREVQDLMVREMKQVLPDIDVKTEATLMDRWMKVDGKVDEKGNYIVMKEKELNKPKE